jgi:hypothetical protein
MFQITQELYGKHVRPPSTQCPPPPPALAIFCNASRSLLHAIVPNTSSTPQSAPPSLQAAALYAQASDFNKTARFYYMKAEDAYFLANAQVKPPPPPPSLSHLQSNPRSFRPAICVDDVHLFCKAVVCALLIMLRMLHNCSPCCCTPHLAHLDTRLSIFSLLQFKPLHTPPPPPPLISSSISPPPPHPPASPPHLSSTSSPSPPPPPRPPTTTSPAPGSNGTTSVRRMNNDN